MTSKKEEVLKFLISTPPGSSPSQVPAHDDSHSQQTIYSDDTSIHSNGHSPYLKILIQPQEQFRFRYKSERESGNHGYLQGDCLASDSTKTFPAVELKNYSGVAVIKCQLYQHDKDEEHPHTLHEENRGDREPKVIVSEQKGYTVYFRGLGIIHTAKRDVTGHLYNKLRQRMSEDEFRKLDKFKLRQKCKNIDLNRVRLRFSAHDVTSDRELCAVYSKTIKNMKSAETNELKICRLSRATGSSKGGQGIMLFVEKVNRGNITVNFFENKSIQNRGWEQPATIHEVHRQFGIFISTPRYKEITSEVTVWMELQRPSDGSRSEPCPFIYTPEPGHLLRKRARRPVDGDALRYMNNVPIGIPAEIIENPSSGDQTSNESFDLLADLNMEHEKAAIQENSLGVFLSLDAEEAYNEPSNPNPLIVQADQLPDLNHVPLQQLNLNNLFYEMDEALEFDNFLHNHRNPLLSQSQYTLHPSSHEEDPFVWASGELQGMLPRLVSDKPQPADDHRLPPETQDGDRDIGQEELLRIYALIKEICEFKKAKLREWYEEITEKLERLFEIRLPNGDTVLHMLLEADEACLRRLVALVRALRLHHLLNERDCYGLSVLHRAVLMRRTALLTYLVLKGCDPFCADLDRNNVVHHAVRSGADTLAALLHAMADAAGHDKDTTRLKLAQCNDEGQTALHVAVAEGSTAGVQLLLAAGAGARTPDNKGWTPLHTAVHVDRVDLVQIILHLPEQYRGDVDAAVVSLAEQSPRYSALQLACAGARPHAAEIAALLLEHGASPVRAQGTDWPAWRLARRAGGELWAVLAPRAPRTLSSPPSSDDSEDDYHSADDGDSETSEDEITAQFGDVKIDNN